MGAFDGHNNNNNIYILKLRDHTIKKTKKKKQADTAITYTLCAVIFFKAGQTESWIVFTLCTKNNVFFVFHLNYIVYISYT